MYRSDKQFMKNPATASSRIYIGNIAETVVAADLDEKFRNHGSILGLVLQRGFGFIQYETDEQAQAAIRNEHASMFHSRKLNVRQAVDKTRLNNGPQSGPTPTSASPAHQPPSAPKPLLGPQPLLQKPISIPKQDPQPEEMDTSTAGNDFSDNQADKQSENEPDSQNRSIDGNSDTSERRRRGRRGGINLNNRSRERDRDRHRDHDRFSSEDFNMRDMPPRDMPSRDMPPRDMPPRDMPPRDMPPRDMPPRDMPPRDMPPRDMPPRDMPPRDMPPRDMPPRDMPPRDMPPRDMPPRDMGPRDMPPRDLPPRDIPPYYGRDDAYRPGPGFAPPPIIERPERNDCEIIVVSRLLTEYAEYIEKRLKSVGLVVDLLFPNEDVPLGRVLANISSRGCLFAILVMPQNEEYRSLTLSILHGIPQEHRNMPVDDAILLITRNFDAYMRGEKVNSTAVSGSASLTDRHPEAIQMLFNLLAENRQISSVQYDRLVKYLQDRRELQTQYETTEGSGESNMELEPNSKQAELQSRIMNILNKSADESPKPVEAPVPPPPGPTPLLNDPSVQKALDSLLSGDMFKTISSGF